MIIRAVSMHVMVSKCQGNKVSDSLVVQDRLGRLAIFVWGEKSCIRLKEEEEDHVASTGGKGGGGGHAKGSRAERQGFKWFCCASGEA